MSTFDPNSTDSVLSRILTELEGLRSDFKSHREETEKRLRALEDDKNYRRGVVAIISIVVSAIVTGAIELLKRK